MKFEFFLAVMRRWLGRERALAKCVVKAHNHVGLCLLLALFALAQSVSASVVVQGDVTPADNPFTASVNEGLPGNGNSINQFAVDASGNPLPNVQPNWEGHTLDGITNTLIPEIVVGQTAFGSLVISGEFALNDENVTIGASGLRNGSGTPRAGTGIMRITGPGAVFNSDPSIIPPGLEAAGLTPATISPNPRPILGADGQGNDLYIGRAGTTSSLVSGAAGNGTLEITAGGRAEIQDAVVLGNDVGSLGTLVVDGIDSYLGSGGFNSNQASNQLHSMVIGKQGVGTMLIQNGATVQTTAAQSFATGNADVAATIGDAPFVFGGQQTAPGGSGTVTVDGASTKWAVAGTLQVGGFTDIRGGAGGGPTDTDLNGINSALNYTSRSGQGTLYVQNGALVNITLQPGIDATQNPPLYLAIGENGKVQLAGGTINIGEVDSTGQNSRGDRSQVVNDGTITGTGTIITGVFRNRRLGRVNVNSGESLTIYASSFLQTTPTSTAILPWNNWGAIDLLGNDQAPATLDLERQSITGTGTNNPGVSFINWSVAQTAPNLPKDGLISCQSCVLRFGSGNAGEIPLPNNVIGLQNYGIVAFTAGTNYVTGTIKNMAANAALNTVAGQILFSNLPGTSVTFEDDFFNAGVPINPLATVINFLPRHSFATNGLNINLDTDHLGLINSGGDVGITGTLNVTLTHITPGSIFVGAVFPLITFSGTLGNFDFSDPANPKIDLTKPGRFTDSNLNTISLVPYGLSSTDVFDIVYGTNNISLVIKAIGNAMGPDFNGDGIVNNLDLAIWQQHVGTQSGASVIDGDANGDGKVDGKDFLIWQQHLGPYPGAGSGSGFGSNAQVVIPEPTSIALVLMSILAWLPSRRRRAG